MKNVKIIMILIVALVFTNCAIDVSYQGRVVQTGTNIGIEGVTVELHGFYFEETKTNSDGFFSISGEMHTDYVNNTWVDLCFLKSGYDILNIECGDAGGSSLCPTVSDYNNLIIEIDPE